MKRQVEPKVALATGMCYSPGPAYARGAPLSPEHPAPAAQVQKSLSM